MVENADRYNVTLTKTKGADQLGLCRSSSHTVSVVTVSVNAVVGQNDGNMLRAYTTYSVTVVAQNDAGNFINSMGSVPFTITTEQTSMW